MFIFSSFFFGFGGCVVVVVVGESLEQKYKMQLVYFVCTLQ